MVESILQALTAVSEVAKRWMDRAWGAQTRDDSRLEQEATRALRDKESALESGDLPRANREQSRYDELHAEARAKSD